MITFSAVQTKSNIGGSVRKALTAGILIIAIFTGAALAVPGIQIPDASFNFGRVAQNAKVGHLFWIKSTGNDTLRITKVVPGCGCTQMPLRDSVLGPGDSTELEVVFSTKGFKGYVTKTPYLETNVGDEKTYVKILAECMPEDDTATAVRVVPARLDVSQFREKPRRKATFEIINNTDADLEITKILGSPKYFKLTLPTSVKARSKAEGSIEVVESMIPKDFESAFTFETSDDSHTRYTIPVMRQYRVKDNAGTSQASAGK
jgi:Protein of unknown function (DUF1573)